MLIILLKQRDSQVKY